MKKIVLIGIFTLAAAQLAFCETLTFQVGATIPRIAGVNYFPEVADIAPALNGSNEKQVIQQLVMRDGSQFVLQTSIVK